MRIGTTSSGVGRSAPVSSGRRRENMTDDVYGFQSWADEEAFEKALEDYFDKLNEFEEFEDDE